MPLGTFKRKHTSSLKTLFETPIRGRFCTGHLCQSTNTAINAHLQELPNCSFWGIQNSWEFEHVWFEDEYQNAVGCDFKKGRAKNWNSGRRIETNKESTACKESKIIRPANNVEILSENCMVGSRRLKKNEWSKEEKFGEKAQSRGRYWKEGKDKEACWKDAYIILR